MANTPFEHINKRIIPCWIPAAQRWLRSSMQAEHVPDRSAGRALPIQFTPVRPTYFGAVGRSR
jgi:hypothetical protein